jgi:hypothetical protein
VTVLGRVNVNGDLAAWLVLLISGYFGALPITHDGIAANLDRESIRTVV